jgi:hypothetical protein
MLISPNNENYGTNCDNLDMLIKEVSEIAEVGLDDVDPSASLKFQKVTTAKVQ